MKIEDDVYIASVGTCLPGRMETQEAVDRGWYDAGELEKLGLSGALVAGDTSPAQLATAAAATALTRAGLGSADLDFVIHSSVFQPGPDGWSLPGYVLRELGGGGAGVLELRTGCSGMLSAIELAVAQITGAPKYSSVLLTAADNFEPWLERWTADMFLPGDAGSALVLGRSGGFARILAANSAALSSLEEMQRGDEPLHPPGPRAKVDLEARHASFGDRVMSALDAAHAMGSVHADLARRTVAEAGIEMADVTRLLYHNLAGFIVDFYLGLIDLPPERSAWQFGRTVGHLGASDQAVALEQLLLTGELKQGDHVMLCGAAAGFSSSCIVLEIVDVPDWPAAAPGEPA